MPPNSRARKGGKKRRREGGVWKNLRGYEDGATKSATCVKGVEWVLGMRGLRIVTAFLKPQTLRQIHHKDMVVSSISALLYLRIVDNSYLPTVHILGI